MEERKEFQDLSDEEKKARIRVLMEIADRAKDLGEYPLANAIFSYLATNLEEWLGEKWSENFFAISWQDQFGPVENQTSTVFFPYEVYYELAVIGVGEYELTIPVPMIDSRFAVAFYKEARRQGNIKEKGDHSRDKCKPESNEIQLLWDMVFEIVFPEDLRGASFNVLVNYDTSPNGNQIPTLTQIKEKCDGKITDCTLN